MLELVLEGDPPGSIKNLSRGINPYQIFTKKSLSLGWRAPLPGEPREPVAQGVWGSADSLRRELRLALVPAHRSGKAIEAKPSTSSLIGRHEHSWPRLATSASRRDPRGSAVPCWR